MEELKEITWKELKDFVLSIPEEFLDSKVVVAYGDTETNMNEPFFLRDDIYGRIGDFEDSGTLKELEEIHEEDAEPFDANNYILIGKKGAPFLWID